MLPPGCGPALSEHRLKDEAEEDNGQVGQGHLWLWVSGWLCLTPFPCTGISLVSLQSHFREQAHCSSRLSLSSPSPAAPPWPPRARSDSAGQLPREWMVQKPDLLLSSDFVIPPVPLLHFSEGAEVPSLALLKGWLQVPLEQGCHLGVPWGH